MFRYRSEIDEIIRAPEFMLTDLETYGYMEGDCDDAATFSASVCRSLGIDSRFMAIRTDPRGSDFRHVFTMGNDGFGGWFRIDVTVPRATVLEFYGEPMIENV